MRGAVSRWVLLPALLLVGCAAPPVPGRYVTVGAGGFRLNGAPFFPLAVNYIVQLQCVDGACWPAPCRNYERGDTFRFREQDSALLQIRAEFRLMREMGFNTVRLVGLASDLQPMSSEQGVFLNAQYDRGRDSLHRVDGRDQETYLGALDQVVRLAGEEGLKLIVLLKFRAEQPAWDNWFRVLARRYRNEPAVMGYDLFNEPLYFDVHDRPKEQVRTLVMGWRKMMREEAPDQLVTIGLVGVPEVFAWDPAVLDVDFISFHPYEHEPGQVSNEIHWYGRYVDKPWIIGETGVPADNDSIPWSDQLDFARATLARTLACGGAGYSWWQFKDVGWGTFHADHLGVMSREGATFAGKGLPLVPGTMKPVVQAFQGFNPNARPRPCGQMPNYYNYSSADSVRLAGRLLDEEARPIEGGVVVAWNADWTRSHYTFTRTDGSFTLYGAFPFHHWMASATRYSMIRGDVQPSAYYTDGSGTPTFRLGDLYLEHLSFADPGS